MNKCRWLSRVEQWFDANMPEEHETARHVESCAVCRDELRLLRALRHGAQQTARRETIGDGQFPAFMAGVREGIEAPETAWRWNRAWAFASVAAAALITAGSVFAVFSGEPAPVEGTVVESWSTDLEDAEIRQYSSENGTQTVWVSVAREDMW